jgi:hypothetical protein
MTSSGSDDRRLAALHAPRRNRYYAGKFLAVSDLEMEQEYLRGADAQLARLVLGAGVVPTNIVLLQLIACLAARVEECCAASPARGNDVPLDLTPHDR